MIIFKQKTFSTLLSSLLALVLLLSMQNALAIDLQSAKKQGLVGETASGYLSAVKPASAEVKALMSDINAKRKHQYQSIAKRNNTSLSAIEQLAGKKAIEKSSRGSYVKPAGSWLKK